jgi:diguanylate cyclase (GGDEF)-like protein
MKSPGNRQAQGEAVQPAAEPNHLAVLNDIARIASGDLELRPMLARVAEALHRHYGWEFVAFLSIDALRHRFVCEAVYSANPTDTHVGYSRELGSGVVGTVAATGTPILYDDVREATNYIETVKGTRSEICVPVRHQQRIIALLNIESTRLAAFHGQLPLLETVAEQVAGAIEGARMYEALMEHAVFSEVMNEVSSIALEPLSLEELQQQVVDYITARFPVNIAAIMLLDEARKRFVTAIYAGSRPPYDGISVDTGICGRCARSGEALYIEDVTTEPDYVQGEPGMEAEFAVPIRYRGRVIGVLNLESTQAQSFSPHARQIFVSVADQIAGAIEGARLDGMLRDHAHVMELLSRLSRLATEGGDLHQLLRKVTDYLATELSMAAVSILLLDEDRTRFVVETMSGNVELGIPGGGEWYISIGICGRCARTGEPQLVYADGDDADYVVGHGDIQSEYVVPIRYQEKLLGVLNLESADRASFTPQVQSLCRAAADQLAGSVNLAVVNQRLLETNRVVEERTRELGETNEKLKRANLELHRISSYDALTGIPNRRRLDEVLAHEWRWAQRTGRPLSFLLADLDHFKSLNDSQGHVRGDEYLRLVAQALADGLMRPADFVARYGGEEFALVLPDLDGEQAQRYAESLRARVEALRLHHGASPVATVMTLSVGAATVVATRERQTLELVAAADTALYAAKNAGRNRVGCRDLTSS